MYPVLYSFRRCPYAMRARMAILQANITVELREIELKQKPAAMLAISAKGTVPVLQINEFQVIDESLQIMCWALAKSDPDNWLADEYIATAMTLISENDGDFKLALDRYKYADRYPEFSMQHYRQQGELFISKLETALQQHQYLMADFFSLADAAILPFVRQFAAVDPVWFNTAPFPAVRHWLNQWLACALFSVMMLKTTPWQAGDNPLYYRLNSDIY